MWVTDYAVNNRITMFVLAALIFVGGIQAYRILPLEASPEIKLPYVIITTRQKGVSAADIEKSITIKIEDKLRGLNKVKEVRSASAEGLSSIFIEFTTGTDIDDALRKVKDKVDLAKPDLPADLDDEPTVTEINFSEFPIVIYSLAGDFSDGGRRISRLADDLKRAIEGIPGVLEVELSGDVEREIQILVKPERLAMYGLTVTGLHAAVLAENSNVPGGSLRLGEGGKLQVRVDSEIRTAADLDNFVVHRYPDGSPVYLKDVAEIQDGLKDRESMARVNRVDSVSLSVKKRSGENIVQVAGAVQERVDEFGKSLPPSIVLTKVADEARIIRLVVSDLENNIATGLFFVICIVMLAMGLRNALVVSFVIPLSMLSAFMVLMAFGISMNMVVLFSLTLATGMLVDTSIVVTENVYRFLSRGVPRYEAAKAAAGEVAMPVAASALTTIVAFIPLLFWPGIMGEFMSYLPRTLIIVLSCNLFIALTISPALAAVFVVAPKTSETATADEVLHSVEHPMLTGGGFIVGIYRRILDVALRYRLATVLLAVLFTVGSIMVWVYRTGLTKGTEFMVVADPSAATLSLLMPEGIDLEQADRAVREVAARIGDVRAGSREEEKGLAPRRSYGDAMGIRMRERRSTASVGAMNKAYESVSDLPDIEYVFEKSSSVIGPEHLLMGQRPNQVTVQFVDYADRTRESLEAGKFASSRMVLNEIIRRVEDIPGFEVVVSEQQMGPPESDPINIELRGDDYAQLGRVADAVKTALTAIPNVIGIRDNYEAGAPTLEIKVNRPRSAALGLNSAAVGNAIRSALSGLVVSTYRADDKDNDIVIKLADADRRKAETLQRLIFASATHGLVPLSTVADITYTGGTGKLTRVNFHRVITVSANVDKLFSSGDEVRMIAEEAMGQFPLPPGVTYEFTGEKQEQDETSRFLAMALPAALLLVLLILVAQFNSLVHPLIIMSEVMLSLGGVFLGLFVFDLRFSIVMVGIAVISLAGVVVNNGIILLDYTLKLIENGMEKNKAIVAAGATRLRPVLLTAFTTMMGVMPIVIGLSFDVRQIRLETDSETAQFWFTMSAVTVWGLLVATMLTLIVVPTLFSLVHDRHFQPVTWWMGIYERWSKKDASR